MEVGAGHWLAMLLVQVGAQFHVSAGQPPPLQHPHHRSQKYSWRWGTGESPLLYNQSLIDVTEHGESLIEEAQIQNNICIPITMFGPKETEQMSITTSIICTRNDSM